MINIKVKHIVATSLVVSTICIGASVYMAFLLRTMSLHVIDMNDQCVSPQTAQMVTAIAEEVSRVNRMCIDSYMKQRQTLRKALPEVYASPVRLSPDVMFEGAK